MKLSFVNPITHTYVETVRFFLYKSNMAQEEFDEPQNGVSWIYSLPESGAVGWISIDTDGEVALASLTFATTATPEIAIVLQRLTESLPVGLLCRLELDRLVVLEFSNVLLADGSDTFERRLTELHVWLCHCREKVIGAGHAEALPANMFPLLKIQ